MLKTIEASKISFGRLIGTTDRRLAHRLGRRIVLARLARDKTIKYESTEEGSLCFYFGGEVYEIKPERN